MAPAFKPLDGLPPSLASASITYRRSEGYTAGAASFCVWEIRADRATTPAEKRWLKSRGASFACGWWTIVDGPDPWQDWTSDGTLYTRRDGAMVWLKPSGGWAWRGPGEARDGGAAKRSALSAKLAVDERWHYEHPTPPAEGV